VIKAPSGKLFSFTKLTVCSTFQSIHPDAQFLFSHLKTVNFEYPILNDDGPNPYISPYCDKKINPYHDINVMIEELEKLIPESERLTFLQVELPRCKYSVLSKELLGATARSAITGLTFKWSDLENEGVYTHWSSLRNLTLYHYDIDEIDSRLFKMFPLLKRLTIYFDTSKSTAKPKTIRKLGQSLKGASHLISLVLHDCQIYQLEEDDLHALVNLKQLKIKVDSVDSVRKLACLSKLEVLNLSESLSLLTIGPDTFSSFPRLNTLNLSKCSISEIDPHAFDQLLKLNELNVSDNDLEKFELGRVKPAILNLDENYELENVLIDDESDTYMSFIEKLSMKSCFEVKEKYFVDTTCCRSGLLKELHIDQFFEEYLKRFEFLRKLELSVNFLNALNQAPFRRLSNLEELHLNFTDYYYG
jgi:Leucine-rich repeat (LRR) protein